MDKELDYNEIVFPKLGIDIHVNSTAFTVFGIDIQWYGILISLGMLLAIIFAMKNFKRTGTDPGKAVDCIIAGVIAGIIGARAYYVIWKWSDYKDNLADIFNIRQGGLAFYGGLIAALLAGCITAKIKKVRILPMLDIVGMGFLIGQSIGRWGNFFNQEAFGSNTDSVFGMSGGRIQQWIAYNSDSLDPSKPVHPCFLYESLWCITGFVLLYIVFRKWRKFDGQMILMYVLWYGTGRFFIEGLRSDSLYIGTIRVSQLLSLLGVVAALIVLIIGLSYVRRNRDSYRLYVETPDGGSTEAAETAEGRDAAENKEEENQINDIKE